MNRKKLFYAVLLFTLLIIAFYNYYAYRDTKSVTQNHPDNSTTIANPASVYCQNSGGRLVMETRGDGGQYGLCYFDDNRACEEWAMYRGECPVGGRKTTGYDSVDQSYCAWSGGETSAQANSQCTFKNGKVCRTIDFYNGKCSRFISLD